jgi:WD40 repeat protein
VNARVSFSPDGKLIALGAMRQNRRRGSQRLQSTTIYLFDVLTGREVRQFRAADYAPTALVFSADGNRLAAASIGGESVVIWNPSTGGLVRRLHVPEDRRHWAEDTPVAFSADGRTLAAGAGRRIVLWDVATGKEVRWLSGHLGRVRCLAFSADGQSLLSGSDDATVLLWNLRPDGKLGRKGEKKRNRLPVVRVLTDDDIEKSRRHLAGSKKPRPLKAHVSTITTLQFSADSKSLLSGGLDGVMILREVNSNKERTRFLTNPVFGATLSHDGRLLASAEAGGRVRIWNTITGEELRSLPGHGKESISVTFSLDGKTLASGGSDGVVQFWRIADGRCVARLKALAAKVTALAFSPDGRSLAVAGLSTKNTRFGGPVTFMAPERIQLWDLATGTDRVLEAEGNHVTFLPDGHTLLASGRFTLMGRFEGAPVFIRMGEDSLYNATRITWWDLRNSKEKHRVERAGGMTAVSRDGSLAASCNGFEGHYGDLLWGTNRLGIGPERGVAVRLWENRSGKEVLPRTLGNATAIALSPDGRMLAWGNEQGTITLWDLTPPDALACYSGLPGEKDLEALWQDLGASPEKAFHAACTLIAARPTAWLRMRVIPVPLVDGKRLAKLIDDLDDDQFPAREAATAQLLKQGHAAEPALRKARDRKHNLESIRRIERVLETLTRRAPSPEEWRQVRVVAVLENIGSPEAMRVLRTLAAGEPEAAATREAQAALGRLRKR